MVSQRRILLVDDDQALADSVAVVLESRGYDVIHARDGTEGVEIANKEDIDVILTDFRMPGMEGMDLLKSLRQSKSNVPIILATAFGTTNLAINATKHGAFEYLTKPFEMPELLDCIDRALQANDATKHRIDLGFDQGGEQDSVIGQSKPMQAVFRDIGRVAEKSVTVLIRGETGTGKELIAQAIHQHSNRHGQPFVAVNCAAIPENLLESELFGHEKGAFTGAIARRVGRFEQADHGTMFLDEIGDLPPQTQVKLLRVLQERAITRVGSKEEIHIDVRVLCATHRSLENMIKANQFREDLYYRLNAASILLPPLRKRGSDINLLIQYFTKKYAQEFELAVPEINENALRALEAYNWPGNVRELENVVRRAVIDANGFAITARMIEDYLTHKEAHEGPHSEDTSVASFSHFVRKKLEAAKQGQLTSAHAYLHETLERELFTHCLELAQGNQSKMSRWLGVSRLTVRDKLDKFGLLPKRKSEDS